MIERFINAHHWAEYLPFISLMAGHPAGSSPLFTRIVETAIMSIVAGAVGIYVGVEVIKNDLLYIKDGIRATNVKVDQVDAKVEQIRRDLYVPRSGG